MEEASTASVADVVARFQQVKERVAAACNRVNRKSESVRIVAVSKKVPLNRVARSFEVGITLLGENRPQELAERAVALGTVGLYPEWHMVGHVQRNKAKLVVEHATLFHALDSDRLAVALNKSAADAGRSLGCLVQVNISAEPNKGGLAADGVPSFVSDLERYEHLDVRGFMGMAAFIDERDEIRRQFRSLRGIRDRAQDMSGKAFPELSMGMSNDFEIAVEEGATLVRIGTAIFGPRKLVYERQAGDEQG